MDRDIRYDLRSLDAAMHGIDDPRLKQRFAELSERVLGAMEGTEMYPSVRREMALFRSDLERVIADTSARRSVA